MVSPEEEAIVNTRYRGKDVHREVKPKGRVARWRKRDRKVEKEAQKKRLSRSMMAEINGGV